MAKHSHIEFSRADIQSIITSFVTNNDLAEQLTDAVLRLITEPHCRVCGVHLASGENWATSREKHRHHVCRPCDNARLDAWKEQNRERQRVTRRARYLRSKAKQSPKGPDE